MTFADWKRMLPGWDFYAIEAAGYPGWNKVAGVPVAVGPFVVVNGRDKSSREMAVAFDDVAAGNFYYRDWTESGLPLVNGGEAYKACFWFQYIEDAERFRQMFPDVAKLAPTTTAPTPETRR